VLTADRWKLRRARHPVRTRLRWPRGESALDRRRGGALGSRVSTRTPQRWGPASPPRIHRRPCSS